MNERKSDDLIDEIGKRVWRGKALKRSSGGRETFEERITELVQELPTKVARSEFLVSEDDVTEIKDRVVKIAAYLAVAGTEVVDFENTYMFEDVEDVSLLYVPDTETFLVTHSARDMHEITATFLDEDTYSLEIGYIDPTNQRIGQRYFSGERPITQMSDEEAAIIMNPLNRAYIGLFGGSEK